MDDSDVVYFGKDLFGRKDKKMPDYITVDKSNSLSSASSKLKASRSGFHTSIVEQVPSRLECVLIPSQ